MKFEEFEILWATQLPATVRVVNTAELRRTVIPELKRRSRMLGYEMFVFISALLIYPMLSVANYRYLGPNNVSWFWMNLPLQMTVIIALLIHVIRRFERHRALLRQGTASLQAFTAMSVANIEAEMQENRAGLWLTPLLLSLTFSSSYANNPVGYSGTRFFLEFGLLVGLLIPMGLVIWRHYHVNLKPNLIQQKDILKQMS